MQDFSLKYTPTNQWTPPIVPSNFHVIYRYCDKRTVTHLNGITKDQCLRNFISIFGTDNMTIIADNCNRDVNAMGTNMIKTQVGNAGALKMSLEMAMELPDNDIVYLVEDDFLHMPGSKELILEALEKVDYVSLYDHKDKYIVGPNPHVTNLGEPSKVFLTKGSHWKLTNSTVQTFATKVRTLKEDKDILWEYNFQGETPDSFRTFIELGSKGRRIASSIPGKATHCHAPWESPLIDWEAVAHGEY